jgi:hypothetical protein
MILSGFSPVKANWWITFGMGADTKKQNNKKSQGGLTFLGALLYSSADYRESAT